MTSVGFAPDDIRLEQPTRDAPLKWVVVVDAELAPGPALNAAVCVAAATAAQVDGLLGPEAHDPHGGRHPGLPWAGCTLLRGSREQLAELRDKAALWEDSYVADMPLAAQETRVYADYLARVAAEGAPPYAALSLVGPRNRVSKAVKRLELA